MLGRIYLVQYTDGRGQAQTERRSLVALDQEGFVVLEVNDKHVLILKARIDAVVEAERHPSSWRGRRSEDTNRR